MLNFLYVRHREKCWWFLTLIYSASILTIPLSQAKLFSIVVAVVGTILYVSFMAGMIHCDMKKE
jgi:hypothetical protein